MSAPYLTIQNKDSFFVTIVGHSMISLWRINYLQNIIMNIFTEHNNDDSFTLNKANDDSLTLNKAYIVENWDLSDFHELFSVRDEPPSIQRVSRRLPSTRALATHTRMESS